MTFKHIYVVLRQAQDDMNKMKYILAILTSFLFFFVLSVQPAEALVFDLIAPEGPFQQGQDVQFDINVDTEGKSMTTTSIGLKFDTQYLEYVSTAVGNTFTTVGADVQGGDQLILTGNSPSGYSGSGTFATLTFKIIADNSGSTVLCSLFNPATPTPTVQPTSPTVTSGGPTITIAPTGSLPTNPPAPTSLPTSGSFENILSGTIIGAGLIVVSSFGFFTKKTT